ncbi:MAG: M56 family metallopeptidase, partial [Terriglobales bacterium]
MESLLLDWSLRALLMAAGTAAALGILRVRTAAARHLAWTGVLAAMLLLPALTAWGLKLAVPMLPPAREQLAPETSTLDGAPIRPASQYVASPEAIARRAMPEAGPPELKQNWAWNWKWIVLVLYVTGFGVMAIRLIVGTIQARAMVRQTTSLDGLRVSAQCASPVTVGWLRPVVILPEDWRSWPEAKLDAVLAHEREHVRRRDPLVQWLALLNRCIFWFHPLAWWLERKLSDLAEEACDATVLRHGHTAQDYSQYLIDLARSVEGAGARVRVWGSPIDGSRLSGRIRRI